MLKMAQRNGLIDRESYVAQYLALALFTIGVARTLGSDDLLAAFAAGQPPQRRRGVKTRASPSPRAIGRET